MVPVMTHARNRRPWRCVPLLQRSGRWYPGLARWTACGRAEAVACRRRTLTNSPYPACWISSSCVAWTLPVQQHCDSGASAFVAGVGEDRDLFQVGAGLGEDELAGGGDVAGAAGQRGGDPQRDAGGTGEGLDEA